MTTEKKVNQFPCIGTPQDKLDELGWPLTLVWIGATLLLANVFGLSEEQGWGLFFLGAGTLTLIGIATRLLLPAYRRPISGDLVWAGFMFGLGTGNWGLILPLFLIPIGVTMLWRSVFQAQKAASWEGQ